MSAGLASYGHFRALTLHQACSLANTTPTNSFLWQAQLPLVLQAGAAAAIASGHPALGSILYCLSLNHKQMGLYYAPAFFMYLLATSCQHPSVKGKVR